MVAGKVTYKNNNGRLFLWASFRNIRTKRFRRISTVKTFAVLRSHEVVIISLPPPCCRLSRRGRAEKPTDGQPFMRKRNIIIRRDIITAWVFAIYWPTAHDCNGRTPNAGARDGHEHFSWRALVDFRSIKYNIVQRV